MKVVKKVWGEEHWIVNKDYCGKKLVLNKNYRCSLHHHKEKDEVFYLLQGKVLLESDGKNIIMKPGDFSHIKPGCVHRFTGLEDSEMIEFSTHHEEEDSYRKELSCKVENEFEDKINSVLDGFEGKRILVIGDIMLDKYLKGDVSRISPEAPVQVVNVKKEKYVLGGAGNVCNNLSSIACNSFIMSIVGRDEAGTNILYLLKKNKINHKLLYFDKNRCTTQKIRVTSQNQQLLRMDYEIKNKLNVDLQEKCIKHIMRSIKNFDIIIISDYVKGIITKDLINAVISSGKKVIIDSKPGNKELYKGSYLITPNLHEASIMSGIEVNNKESINQIGKKLLTEYSDNVLITCGSDGMYLFEKNGSVSYLPVKAREVYDVTGAGDTVIAVIGASLSAGATLKEACFIANHAAGIVVGKTGTSTISIEEIKKSIENE